jgi:hypothetical protein
LAGPLFLDNSFSIFFLKDCNLPVNDLGFVVEVEIDSERDTVGRVRPEWYRGRVSPSMGDSRGGFGFSEEFEEVRAGGGGGAPGN